MKMRFSIAMLLLIIFGGSAAAQQQPSIFKDDSPMFNLSVGYDHTQANAPPGICQCFGTNGGYGSASFFFTNRLAVEAQVTGSTSSHISSLGQNLNLYTYMAGPKVAFPIHRITIFGQVLFGGAHGTNSYFPTGNSSTTSSSSFALAPGGSIDFDLTPRFSIRMVQAQYLRTTFPNGETNEQNQLQIGAGIVFKFGERSIRVNHAPPPPPVTTAPPPPPPPPPPAPKPELACSADATSVPAGQAVAITGRVTPDSENLVYTWNTSGGHLLGAGSHVSIDTTALPEGNYTVTGRVQPTSDPSMSADCEVTFAVTVPPPPPAPPQPQSLPDKEKDFRANVHDVYFDFNKSTLRPEGIVTIQHDAEYLTAHPDLRVTIGGFADQRGSSSYNLALGERRAHAVKDKLIEDGVPADNIQIVTFGRDAQTCTAGNENCWQQNRRVAFLMRP
jgi:outer membrane protein OmpA-like peptidoglycan-associated protein